MLPRIYAVLNSGITLSSLKHLKITSMQISGIALG